MVKAVIFDMDGTLVDSVDLHAKAWPGRLPDFGHRFELWPQLTCSRGTMNPCSHRVKCDIQCVYHA
jgi:beta-phosphoglucomutase-like phosphatase (HAD superfamily)